MSDDDWRRLRVAAAACFLAAAGWLWLPAGTAWGQSQANLPLAPIEQSAFPRMETLFHLYESNGQFISGITPANIRLQEAGQALPVQALEEEQPGAQFVLALTYGQAYSVRDALGVSRYDMLLAEMAQWQNDWTDDQSDSLGLIVDGGPELLQQSDGRAWLQALLTHTPGDLRARQPDITVLSRALEIAAATPARPGMGRGVLLITPLLPNTVTAGLPNLAASAQSQGIRVHIWLVAPPESSLNPQIRPLSDLAAQTGGEFLIYSGSGQLPALEEYLQPLRRVYRLAYETPVRSSGVYSVSLQIEQDGRTWQSQERSWTRTILAPNPIFINLPSVIQRSAVTATASGEPGPTAAAGVMKPAVILQPESQELNLLIEFPDGSPRALVRTALYVDDQLVAENLAAPFEHFTWDLSGYEQSRQHWLRVEASDSLGLTGSSLPLPVEIAAPGSSSWQVNVPPQIILGSGVALAGAAALVALALVLTGRIAPHRKHLEQQAALARRASQGVATVPRARPVSSLTGTPLDSRQNTASAAAPLNSAPQRLPGWMSRLRPGPTAPSAATANGGPAAYLTPLALNAEDGQEISHGGAPLPLEAEETVLGRDAAQATWALDDPALDAVHARLQRQSEAGETRYWIRDAGSIGGTWVNYTLTPPAGVLLRHGDIIHIGRSGFRFQMRQKNQQRKVHIQPYED